MKDENQRLRYQLVCQLAIARNTEFGDDESVIEDCAYLFLETLMGVDNKRVIDIVGATRKGLLESQFQTCDFMFDCDCDHNYIHSNKYRCPDCGGRNDDDHSSATDYEVWIRYPYYTMEYIHTGDKHLTREQFEQWEKGQAEKQKKEKSHASRMYVTDMLRRLGNVVVEVEEIRDKLVSHIDKAQQ